MKVLFVTVGTEGTASTRMRVYNYLPMLNEAGVETKVVLAPQGRGVLRSPLWKYLRWPDVIVVQKAWLSPLVSLWLGLSGKPRIYDIDDALFSLPSYMASETERARRIVDTNRMMRWADMVCTANNYLAEYARTQNSRKVVMILMGVDCTKFHPAATPSGDNSSRTILGWVGAADKRHFENVSLLVEPLRQLAQKHPFTFRLVGLRDDTSYSQLFSNIPGIQFETVSFRPSFDHIPQEVRQLNVGLSPLVEDAWTLGKSPTKILEYMASGVLTIASPVGTQKETIQDGENGFLAGSTQEWVDKIEYAMLGAPDFTMIRQKALETVRTKYSVESCGKQILEMFHQLIEIDPQELRTQRKLRLQ